METQINKLKIFEAYVLRFLSVDFILIGIFYLFLKDWTAGIFLIITSFFFGFIGQGLKHNISRSATELSKGQDFNFVEQGNHKGGIAEENRSIGKSLMYTSWIVILTSGFLLFHHDFRWYLTIPVALVIGLLLPSIMFYFGVSMVRMFSKIK